MNDFFSLKRFGQYWARQYSDNRKRYLVGLAAIAGSIALLIVIVSYAYIDRIGLIPTLAFVFLMPFLISLAVIAEMAPLRGRHTASIENCLPVSLFEKYLYILLNTTVVFIVSYTVIYSLLALGSVFVFGNGTPAEFFRDKWMFGQIYVYMLMFQAFVFFAGTLQLKNHILAALLVLVLGVITLGSPVYFSSLFDGVGALREIEVHPYYASFSATVDNGNASVSYATEPLLGKLWYGYRNSEIVFCVWTLLMWICAWFGMKERQVK